MIKSINLTNFRNHDNLKLEFNKNFIYINGSNGSGKTSVLEAINYIATTKSHRTNNDIEVIRRGEKFSKVLLITDKERFEMIISEKGKIAKVNNKEVRKLSDYINKLKVVFFAPEDLNLIKGAPGVRRNFLNLELSKINKSYLTNLSRYNDVLKQRNALLKNINLKDDLTFLNILGEQLLDVGIKVINEREIFLKELNDILKEVYKSFNDEPIELIYSPSVSAEAFKKHIYKNQRQDILYENTLSGPHRDDFYINFKDVKANNASQGEIRLMVISLKLSLVKMLKSKLNDEVYLLLDDVLSELDLHKQKIFLNNIPKDIQIIMNSAININSSKLEVITLEDKE